ncbi:MAG: hypothetical protein KDA25_02160, partial [Phycisphaerales bacterium]|nr:hypothetical protein [Phycisphaerales bacterium]
VGSPRALERIAGLAAQLQDQLPAQPGTVRYIALPTAVDADTVRDLVEATLRQMSGGRQGMASRVSVLADDLNNALVVVSNAIDFETVGDLVAALSNPPRMDEMIVKVYPLTMITAERAAESVRTLVSGGVSERDRRRNRQADRMRELALRLMAGGDSIEAVFDPNRVSVASDAQTNSIIVMGPTGAVGFIDRFVELLDQAPVNAQATLKTFALHHATASDLRETLRDMFRARFRSMRDRLGPGAIEPDFGADDRTNTLLVTASPEQLAEVETLIAQLDVSPGEERFALRMIELQAARPTQAAEILRQVVLGTDQKRRTSTLIVPSDDSGVLMVRASDAVYAEIESVLREIDRTPTSTFKVRTLTLERADATMVAQAIQKFYDDRAKIASTGRGRREQGRRISIVGDTNSNTLLVAAADEDFEEIRDLITRFDSEEANRSLEYRVFTLRHAKATEIESTVNDLINDLTWNQPFFWDGRGGGGGSTRDKFAIRADERLNALIVTGEGDKFDVVQQMIDLLDAPPSADRMKVVRVYPIQHADVDVVRQVVEQSFNDAQSRIPWWRRGNETGDVQVIVNAPTRTLIVRAAEARQTDIAALIESVDSSIAMPGHETQVVPVEFAEASELARSLTQFLEQRTKAGNATASTATIVASRSIRLLRRFQSNRRRRSSPACRSADCPWHSPRNYQHPSTASHCWPHCRYPESTGSP